MRPGLCQEFGSDRLVLVCKLNPVAGSVQFKRRAALDGICKTPVGSSAAITQVPEFKAGDEKLSVSKGIPLLTIWNLEKTACCPVLFVLLGWTPI